MPDSGTIWPGLNSCAIGCSSAILSETARFSAAFLGRAQRNTRSCARPTGRASSCFGRLSGSHVRRGDMGMLREIVLASTIVLLAAASDSLSPKSGDAQGQHKANTADEHGAGQSAQRGTPEAPLVIQIQPQEDH